MFYANGQKSTELCKNGEQQNLGKQIIGCSDNEGNTINIQKISIESEERAQWTMN